MSGKLLPHLLNCVNTFWSYVPSPDYSSIYKSKSLMSVFFTELCPLPQEWWVVNYYDNNTFHDSDKRNRLQQIL